MKFNKIFFLLVLTLLLSSFAYADLTDNNVLYYSFDNSSISGSTISDLSPSSNNGTNNGATTGTTGLIGDGLFVDGSSGYVSMGYNPINGSSARTYSIWVNPTSLSSSHRVYFSGNLASLQDWTLVINSGGTIILDNFISRQTANGLTVTTSNWQNIIVTLPENGSVSDIKIYLDDVEASSYSTSSNGSINTGTTYANIGAAEADNLNWHGYLDEFAVYDIVLNSSQRSQIYNSGTGFNPYQVSNFTITAIDNFYNTSINTFNATVNGTFYETTNGTVVTKFLTNETNLINITVEAEDYFSNTTNSYNISSSGNLEARLEPSLFTVEVNAYDIINTSIQILNFTLENNGVNFTTTNGSLYPEFPTSKENITIYADGYFTKTIINQSVGFDFNVTLLAEEYINASPLFYINDSLRNTQILDFTANITSVNTDYDTMNLSIIAEGYFTTTFTNRNITGDRNFTINPDDSFYFIAKDQNDLAIINQDIIINLQQGVNEQELNISNGEGIIENISPNLVYTLVVSTTGYETKSFTYEHDGNTNPLDNLTVYLINSSEVNFDDIDFNLVDISNLPVEEVLVTARAFINGSYEVVSSGETDITGRKTFFLDTTKRHQITISKTGFVTQEFFIDPPLDLDYTFRIDRTDQYVGNDALKNIIYEIDPRPVTITNTTYELNFTVTALDNDLEYFNINVLVRNVSTGVTTNLAFNESSSTSGGLLTVNPDFSTHYGKLAILKYCLKKTDFNEVCFYSNYIVDKDYGDQRNFGALKTYIENNLTTGERVFFFSIFLLVTMIVLVAIPFTRNIFAILPIAMAAIFYAWLFLPTEMLIIVGIMTTILVLLLLSRVS